jgi:predicted Zn-dependent protease
LFTGPLGSGSQTLSVAIYNATVTHGFLVEGGEVKQAVRGVVLAGDAYKLLSPQEGLAALSKEAEAIVNYIVPAVLLSGVSVAGE